jgi:alkylation response protein AidB-like acyl-CoA dehydrogenase
VTLEYVKRRRQFGRAIGSFQAVQHRLAQCAVQLEGSRWLVYEADGHDVRDLIARLNFVKQVEATGQPQIIIAHTIKGKGVSFMENVADWHGKAPCVSEADQALCEIRRCICEI